MNCEVLVIQLQTIIYSWPFLSISVKKNLLDCVDSVAIFGEKYHPNNIESSNSKIWYLSPSSYLDII